MKESNLHRLILRDVCDADTRLFRNHVGYGLVIRHKNPAVRERIMSACIEMAERMGGSGERMRFGLAPDSADLIGAHRELVTPQWCDRMAGKVVAVFCSIEVKTATGRPGDGQVNWDGFMRGFGARSGFARSVEEARDIIKNTKQG
ncbi:hypothetical protein [Bradyrhizobium sp.]|uniref:hypothetical protein n=1 Tax=Bradyrhizobium sp. TaxID=376 RepID=UPI0039E424A8